MKKNIMSTNSATELFVGLDVHKDSIEIATADHGRNSDVRRYGRITGDLAALDKVLHKLQSTTRSLEVVYEAGPCGYAIYRPLPATRTIIGTSGGAPKERNCGRLSQ